MIDYMYQISDKAYELSKSRWKCEFDELEKLEKKWNFDDNSVEQDHSSLSDDTCAESNEVEPPSEEFKRAISKENVYYSFMKRFQTNDTLDVRYNDWTDSSDNENDDIEDEAETQMHTEETLDEAETNSAAKRIMSKLIAKYKEEFQTYCRQAVCLGFNSGKYDINLLRKPLVKQFGMHLKPGSKYVVKNNDNYQCTVNDRLKPLDLVNYLPPGTSYA